MHKAVALQNQPNERGSFAAALSYQRAIVQPSPSFFPGRGREAIHLVALFDFILNGGKKDAGPHAQGAADAEECLQRRFSCPTLNGAQMCPANICKTAQNFLGETLLFPESLNRFPNDHGTNQTTLR